MTRCELQRVLGRVAKHVAQNEHSPVSRLEGLQRRKHGEPEIGVLMAKQQTSTLTAITPVGGLCLWAAPNVFAGVSAGYLLPLQGQAFDELPGFRVRAGVDLAFW